MEQGTGVEPASEAWEATIIADIRTLRRGLNYSIGPWKLQAELFDRVRDEKQRKPENSKIPSPGGKVAPKGSEEECGR